MRALLLPAAAVVLLGVACARNSQTAPDGSPAPEAGVLVSVDNQTWSILDVFAISSTMQVRLGQVEALSTGEMRVPEDVVALGSFQLRVRPVGGGQPFVTDPITANPGERVRLRLQPDIATSTWVIEGR